MTAAFAAMLAASVPMAYAQTNANPTPPATGGATVIPPSPAQQSAAPPPTTATPPANHTAASAVPSRVMPGQMRFADMNGATVYGPQDKSIGDINNVILDRDGKIAAVVIKTGGFLGIGGKTVAVGMKDLKASTDKDGKLRFALNMTEDQLKSAQAFDPNPPKKNNGTATGSSTPPASRQK